MVRRPRNVRLTGVEESLGAWRPALLFLKGLTMTWVQFSGSRISSRPRVMSTKAASFIPVYVLPPHTTSLTETHTHTHKRDEVTDRVGVDTRYLNGLSTVSIRSS